VRNTGKRVGKDVAQVYVAGSGWEAPKRLGAFRKVELKPGQSQTVTVDIDPRLLATWDAASHSWKVAGGSYEVVLGEHSRDVKARARVTIPARTLPVGWRP
jgi:beta-glucosidase